MTSKKIALYTYGGDQLHLRHIDMNKVEVFTKGELYNFLNSSIATKIAAIELNYTSYESTAEEISKLKDCQLIIIKTMECDHQVYEFIQQFDLPNILYVINSIFNTPLRQAKIVPSFPWLYSTAFLWQNELNWVLTEKISAFTPKPYFFEILYGKPRPHRIFAHAYLQKFADTNYFLGSPNFGQVEKSHTPAYNVDNDLFWEDEIKFENNNDRSSKCTYMGVHMNVWAQVLPFKVYSQTAYSLICETMYVNEFSFFSEKIAKPIIACRLFIAISGKYYLRNLRSLGFKTFDGIIDESYDDIEDDTTRWTMALDQAVKLCSMDQEEVLQKIAPIVLHNYLIIGRLNTEVFDQQVELALINNKCFKE